MNNLKLIFLIVTIITYCSEGFSKSERRIELPSREPQSSGNFVFAPIEVAASCLTCHGSKEARPKFIVEKYPNDLAHGFRAGDLRGMYSVFVPL